LPRVSKIVDDVRQLAVDWGQRGERSLEPLQLSREALEFVD
jgi:hypothetical protein